MTSALQDHIATGGRVKVDLVADKIVVATGGEALRVDLADKAIHRLLEDAPLVIQTPVGTTIRNR